MFSSKNLISFVFANENDTYYRDDLLKLNRDQYLWYQLHERFETVYFLRDVDGQFQVHSFGDCNGSPCPVFKNKLFKTAEDQLGKWLLQQMRKKAGHAVAFVCTLQDFCAVLSKAQWKELLLELSEDQNRTGIFVLTASATAERNTDLLLNSAVFDYLKETAVVEQRSGELRDLYGSIYRRKWGSCFFFNEFTRERIHALLLHVVMKNPDRLVTTQELDRLATWLYKYLNSSVPPGNDSLFESKLPVYYLTYEELYTWLCKETVWNRLKTKAGQGSVSKIKERPTHILRDPNSYAGKCMQLKLPSWVNADTEEGIRVYRLLREIRDAVSVPKNKSENPQLQEAANSFMAHLDAVPSDDFDSYMEVLNALKLCVDWIYVDPASDQAAQLQEIIRNQMDMLEVLRQHYIAKQNLRNLLLQDSDHALHKKTVTKLSAELRSMEKMRSIYEEFIQMASWELTVPSTEHSTERLKDLNAKLESYRQKKDTQTEPARRIDQMKKSRSSKKEEQSSWVGCDDEDLELRPEDAGYIPPV